MGCSDKSLTFSQDKSRKKSYIWYQFVLVGYSEVVLIDLLIFQEPVDKYSKEATMSISAHLAFPLSVMFCHSVWYVQYPQEILMTILLWKRNDKNALVECLWSSLSSWCMNIAYLNSNSEKKLNLFYRVNVTLWNIHHFKSCLQTRNFTMVLSVDNSINGDKWNVL